MASQPAISALYRPPLRVLVAALHRSHALGEQASILLPADELVERVGQRSSFILGQSRSRERVSGRMRTVLVA